jgi:hypothetical protein
VKVRLKLSTMVPTPTLTASASSSAIKASDSPDNCRRLSAQNHFATGRLVLPSPAASTRPRIAGSASAAPISSAASTVKPATSESPSHSTPAAPTSTITAKLPCSVSQRPCACCHAYGCAAVSSGNRAAFTRLDVAAASAPRIEIARPASHHCGFKVSCPGIVAPYNPRKLAATSGSRDAAMK